MDKNHNKWKTASTRLSVYKPVPFLLYEKAHVPKQDKDKVPLIASSQDDDNAVSLAITNAHPTKEEEQPLGRRIINRSR